MTTITALPTPPSRADSTNFSTRGDAFLGALPTFVTEANAVGSEATAAAAAAAASASAAAASQSTASTAAAAVAAQSPVANAAAAAASAAAAAASAAAAAQTSGAVAATTLSASGAVSGAGFSAYLASPPAIGGTAPAAVSATSLTDSGNLTFTGTGNRITGDFSNATLASRVSFQTSTANSNTSVAAIPSGTGGSANFSVYGASDPSNSSRAQFVVIAGTDARLNSDLTGIGTYLPMTFYTGGSERVRFDTSGNVGIGKTPVAGRGVLQVNGDTEVTSLNTGQLAGLRNKIINGGFDIWQRGTSGFTANTFSADRWLAVTNGTTTSSRQTFTPGAAPVAGYEAAYYLRYDRTATGTYQYLEQRVEDVRTFAGQTVTLSFFAKANSAITITPYCEQYYGTGGSPSASTACTSSSTVTITTSWARYSVQVTVPSISGKTLGTNNDSSLIVRPIYIVDALAHTIDIWGVQLELGSVATPFEQRPYGMELSLCQRYYQQQLMANGSLGAATVNIAFNTNTLTSLKWQIPMRVAPTVVLYSRNNTANKVSSQASGSDVGTSVTASNTSIFGASPLMDSGAGFTVGTIGYEVFYTASAEL